MGVRTALRRNGWITFLLLLAMGWIVLIGRSVVGPAGAIWTAEVGQTAASGIIGLLVMATVLVMAIVLFGELGESEPAPQRFPPE